MGGVFGNNMMTELGRVQFPLTPVARGFACGVKQDLDGPS